MESPAVKEPQSLEETISDTPTSQIIDRSETPDSNKGLQDNDSVSSSPRICKPVLGKAQAKKRLMAFAKFNVSVKAALEKSKEKEKIQIKPLIKDLESQKLKAEDPKSLKTPGKIEESHEFHPDSEDDPLKLPSSRKKSKKPSEKKISAIDEIIQEESRQRQLIAGEISEKTTTVDQLNSRQQTESRNRDTNRRYRNNRFRNNYADSRRFNSRFNSKRSPQNRQNDHRNPFGLSNQPVFSRKQRNSSERRDNDRGRDSRSRRDRRLSISHEEDHNVKPQDLGKLEEGIESRVNRQNKDRRNRNSFSETERNWKVFKSQGHTIRGKIPHHDPPNGPAVELRSKHPQDYKNHFDQMLMVSDVKLPRSRVLINGIDDGMREFPPESIRITRRFKGNMFYAENPNISLYLNKKRLTQVLSPETCKIMREISDVPFKNLETDEAPIMRNWFKRFDNDGKLEIVRKITSDMDINPSNSRDSDVLVPPKSRWEVEAEESLEDVVEPQVDHIPEEYVEEVFEEQLKIVEAVKSPAEEIDRNMPEENEEVANGLVSEYEEFMKMVSREPEASEDNESDDSDDKEISDMSLSSTPSKIVKSKRKEIIKIDRQIQKHTSKDSGAEKTLPLEQFLGETPEIPEKMMEEEDDSKSIESPEVTKLNDLETSIESKPSRASNGSNKTSKKKKKITSTETSESSSTDSEHERRKRKRKRRRKKKRSRYTSTSSSSSDDSSSEEISKKRKKNSRKRRKHKKAKLHKKRSRRDSSDSDSSSSPQSEERSRKRKKEKKIVSKNSKTSKRDRSRSSEKHKLHKIKKEIEEEDIPLEKNPVPVLVEIPRELEPSKTVKIVIKVEKNRTPSVSEQEDGEIKEAIDEFSSKSPEFQLEKDEISVVNGKESLEIINPNKIAAIPIPEEIHPSEILKPEEIPLPSTPLDSREIPLPTDDKPEEELLEKKREIERELLKTRRSTSSQKKRRSASIGSTSSSSSTSSYSSSSSSSSSQHSEKHKKKHRSKKKYRSRKKSFKITKKSRNKWAPEFDFDFPSLTQLEQGAERVGTLIDDWEVDSMEAVSDSVTSNSKDKSKKLKKIEKEVRYDEKTDTYIAVEKELTRENKKKTTGRICALRIWEDEEEEGEREALLIKETTELKEKPSEAATAPEVGNLETTKEITLSDEQFQEPKERKDNEEWLEAREEVSKPEEKCSKVRKTRWEKKITNLSIPQDPPTPEGPLVPVNWEEEEEWVTPLKFSIDRCAIKPVEAPTISPDPKLNLELENTIKLGIKEPGTNINIEKKLKSLEKDQLYSPSSPADSHKSITEGGSSSRDSSSDTSTSSESSSESTESPKILKEDETIKSQLSQSIEAVKSSTPPLVSPSKPGAFLSKRPTIEDPLHQLKMDMFSKLRDQGLEKLENKDQVEIKPDDIPSKRSSGSKTLSNTPSKVSTPLEEESPKSKEVFRNTFIEVTPRVSRSPSQKSSPRDSEKSKLAISEEKTSNSSYRNRSSKDPEKSKFDDKFRRDRSPSPRSERRRFNSPGDRKYVEKRRSPSWKKRNSKSRSRSWSRSQSRSPDKMDRSKRCRYPEERRERFSSSGHRSQDRRSRERGWSLDKSDKSYDPLEILRVNNRFREPEFRRSRENFPKESSASQDIQDIRPLLELNFDDRNYLRDSRDREIIEGQSIPPLCPDLELKIKYRRENSGDQRGRDIDWERRESSERFSRRRLSERRPRSSRLSPRLRRSPRKSDRRFSSRSRSRSWTRSHSRSRSRTPVRSWSHERSSSRSRSRSRQSVERRRRKSRSMSFSPRGRRHEDNRFGRSTSRDKGRKIETIVHPPGMNPPAPEEMSNTMINEGSQPSSSFRYQSDTLEDFTYFASNNLTYPPRVEESAGSPKRLSLDDRLELELGIKKSQETLITYPQGYPHMPGASPFPLPPRGVPGGPQGPPGTSGPPGLGFHRPTVLQVGNVLQVVPRDYHLSGVPPVSGPYPEMLPTPVPPTTNCNKVLRVGNVLQVVPTTNLDWSGSGPPPPSMDRPPPYSLQSSNLPVPVPVPSVITSSPHPLPVIMPQIPSTPTVLPKLVRSRPPPVPQPVYNYEAIMEARKKEKEERRRLREEKRNEKENRRIIRVRKRAEKVIDKVNRVSETAEAEVAEESNEIPEDSNKIIDDEDEEAPGVSVIESSDVKVFGTDYDEDEEVDLEGEVDEDEEDEDEVEESEEEPDDEDSRIIPVLGDLKECEETRAQIVEEVADLVAVTILPTPKKGILVPPGLWANRLLNGDAEEDETVTDKLGDSIEVVLAGEMRDVGEFGDDEEKKEEEENKEKRVKARRAKARARKAVQFADGVKPGEGTSPSGGEGDMPSPPPPASASLNDPFRDILKKRMRKRERKKPKRIKLPKTKKKVKVKIIKLKKPKITPLTALMLDDSDEMNDRSPPPPPPGSPPPPHQWPSYLAAYSATLKTVDTVLSPPRTIQAAPPPTPLPLLVPPPPLNYTIQPLNKA